MKVLTIKSEQTLSEEIQNEIHHTFGMEHHTDYVFKARSDAIYSATIVIENSDKVIATVKQESVKFPDRTFVIDDLDMEKGTIERFRIKNGKVVEKLETTWEFLSPDL